MLADPTPQRNANKPRLVVPQLYSAFAELVR